MKKTLLFFAALILIGQKMFAYNFSAIAPTGQTLYFNIVNGNAHVTSQNDYGYGGTGPTGNLIIPSSVSNGENTYPVTAIDSNAFERCYDLTAITIPSSVTSIGNWAFSCCYGLTSVTIPNSVTSIGRGAFSFCIGLTSITFPDSVTSIGHQTFWDCSSLTSITIPNSVTTIGVQAFEGCSSLTSITIPNSVTSIGEWAFTYCSSLTSFTIPDSVTYIGEYAFSSCSSLTSITIPNSVTFIGRDAFSYCDCLTIVNINATYCTSTAIEGSDSPFYSCPNISMVNIGNNVTTIPPYLFYGCDEIQSIDLPDSLISIGKGAFQGCSGLATIILSVDTIHECTFKNCDHITNITFGSGLSAIENEAFDGCTQVVRIVCKAMNPPVVQNSTFSGLRDDVILNVPCDAANAYENAAYWFRFNIQEDLMYDFSATSSDPSRGTVSIITEPTCDYREAQVQANAYHGYHFDHWSDGNTDNPRYIVVLQDTHLVAYFASDNGEDEGIEDATEDRVKLYQRNGQIVVEGAEGYPVCLYDVVGRLLATRRGTVQEVLLDVPASGAYLVKIGDAPARCIVVQQ